MSNFGKIEESVAKYEFSILGSCFPYKQIRRFSHTFLADESSKVSYIRKPQLS